MCGCDELEHSSKCGGCAKLQVSEKNVVPIVSLIDLQEYNKDGIPVPKLVKLNRDNEEINLVFFDSNRPFLQKLKNKFRDIVIQRGGEGSMSTIVKRLFDEGVFPQGETFEDVFKKVFEDYIHGLIWGILIKIYRLNNTTRRRMLPFFKYNPNYLTVFDTGFNDAVIDDSKLNSTRLKGGGSTWCPFCGSAKMFSAGSCNDCTGTTSQET